MPDASAVTLRALVRRVPGAEISGDENLAPTGIETDSRAVRPGQLFVALAGTQSDGHRYVGDAFARGAVAAIVQRDNPVPAAAAPAAATMVTVPDARSALSAVSAAFYGDPSQSLDVIGVTGTNGKTTTVHMLKAILEAAGIPNGTIGTVGAAFGQRTVDLLHTTPLPPQLQRLFAEMRDDGTRAVAMEVSSHALALGRVDDVRFRIAVLTNVTRDHLDFHRSMEAYSAAKRRLFEMAPVAVLNADDPYGARWIGQLAAGARVVAYGMRSDDVKAENVSLSPSGSRFDIGGRAFELRLPGRFNVANALAAIAAARQLGVEDAVIARGLAAMPPVPGRMERFSEGGIDVVVDYAHTPDALESVLRALRETTRGGLAIVFGCGGERDRGKRAIMGDIAGRYADAVYVTSDNPRGEAPSAIAADVVAGISGPRVVELDRRRAIERAVTGARSGDTVLIAGKGHERRQTFADSSVEFDDVAEARSALRLRGALR